MNKRKKVVSVIGGHECSREVGQMALEVGRFIAEAGAVLCCGGLDGVMTMAAKGAKEAGGLTIGVTPGKDKEEANAFIDIPIPTTIGYARNVIVVCAADVIVALPGSHGTSCEISYAFVYNRPVIDLGGWKIPGMIPAANIEEAKQNIAEFLKRGI